MTESSDKRITLADWLPSDSFVGSSLILQEGLDQELKRYLFGIRPAKSEGGQQILELTGIGGKIEERDSSVRAGVIREAQEEIACAVRLIPSSKTLQITGREKMRLVEFEGPEKPLAVIHRHHRTPAHHPWHAKNQGAGWLVVFLAELQGRPRPQSELPNLIWLPAHLIYETAHRYVSLGELLVGGAALIPGRGGSPPLDQLTRMTDSQEALSIALGKTTRAFYESLFGDAFPESLFVSDVNGATHTAEAVEHESRFPIPFGNHDIGNLLEEGDVLLPGDNPDVAQEVEATESTLGIQLEATSAVVKKTREELAEANRQIQHLATKIEQLELAIRHIQENKTGWTTPFRQLWNWLSSKFR